MTLAAITGPVCLFPTMTLCGRVRLEVTGGGNWRPRHSGCSMGFACSFYPHLQCELCAKGRTKWEKCNLVRKAFINLKLKAWILKIPPLKRVLGTT